MSFTLDAQLASDCFELGRLGRARLLLMDNAALPWFILVPETECVELTDLPLPQQQELLADINRIASLITTEWAVDKLNIAAIGNVVRQLHIHIVGRSEGDYCWPGVVWGAASPGRYDSETLVEVRMKIITMLSLEEVV